MKRAGLSMYRKIYWLPLVGLLFLMMLSATAIRPGSSPPILFMVFFVVLVLWAIFGRVIAYWIVPLFVSNIKCPGCGEEMSTVNVWNCACGFRDHRERNVLTKRCPKCGRGASDINCPRCSATILLW